MEQDPRYQVAKKRVEEIKGFYMHLGIYMIVSLALFAINMIATPDARWFHWPVLAGGAAVAMHAFVMVTENKLLGPEWEEKRVRELLGRSPSVGGPSEGGVGR